MASIKFHVYRGEDNGTEGCDYRGDKFIGALSDPRNVQQVEDHHRTIPQLEIDPASDDLVEEVLAVGPSINALFDRIKQKQDGAFGKIASLLGLGGGDSAVGLRVGVWDD